MSKADLQLFFKWNKCKTKNVEIAPKIAHEFPPETLKDDLKLDTTAPYYINIAGKESLDDDRVYRVEILAKHHGREDVKEAKIAELKNLKTHNTWTMETE